MIDLVSYIMGQKSAGGGGGADSPFFIVNFYYSDNGEEVIATCDKTYEEIRAAAIAGKTLYARISGGTIDQPETSDYWGSGSLYWGIDASDNDCYNASIVNIGQTPDYPSIAMYTTTCMINERNKVSVSFGAYTLTPIDETP